MNLLINNLHVLDKLPCSDHLPMVVIFDIDINVSLPTQVSTDDVITSFSGVSRISFRGGGFNFFL